MEKWFTQHWLCTGDLRDDIISMENMAARQKRSPKTVGDLKILICLLHDLWTSGDVRDAFRMAGLTTALVRSILRPRQQPLMKLKFAFINSKAGCLTAIAQDAFCAVWKASSRCLRLITYSTCESKSSNSMNFLFNVPVPNPDCEKGKNCIFCFAHNQTNLWVLRSKAIIHMPLESPFYRHFPDYSCHHSEPNFVHLSSSIRSIDVSMQV